MTDGELLFVDTNILICANVATAPHFVLDLWFADEVKSGLCGRAFMIRFADNVVIG